MSRIWFAEELETVATYWRVMRRDGVALGFTTHDRDLWFGGMLHRAAPGMLPSALRRPGDFEPDSAEVRGAITHDAISRTDLLLGRFDDARVGIGLVDWRTLEHALIYTGTLGEIAEDDGAFNAELVSRKAELLRDTIPRTSPTCRAEFCGPGCTLSSACFTHETHLVGISIAANALTLDTGIAPDALVGGSLRWLDGPQASLSMEIIAAAPEGLIVGTPLEPDLALGTRAIVREGCDRTLATCAERFGNAINFQGEPFLPGNDIITRHPMPVT